MTKGFQSSSAEKSRRRLYIHGRVYNTRRYSKRLLSDLVHVRLNNWSAIVFFTNEFYLESLVSCFNNERCEIGEGREKENILKKKKKGKREKRRAKEEMYLMKGTNWRMKIDKKEETAKRNERGWRKKEEGEKEQVKVADSISEPKDVQGRGMPEVHVVHEPRYPTIHSQKTFMFLLFLSWWV